MTEPTTFAGTGTTPYSDYQSVPVLLSLQHPRSDSPDEPMFLIMAQAQELMFKGTRDEVAAIQRAIQADDLEHAMLLLERVKRMMITLATCWDVHATITPTGYLGFRSVLQEGSGFQSPSYRRLEYVLGNKKPSLAEVHRGTWAWNDVETDLRTPGLWHNVHEMLVRRGLLDASVLPIALADEAEPCDEIEAAWLAIYRNGQPADVLRLADRLVDLATAFHDFRQRHLTTVERLMGHRPGTGGTSGVEWLRRITEHRFFPELWMVRTNL
jgi:tryptophan 2,3-dioxygenase